MLCTITKRLKVCEVSTNNLYSSKYENPSLMFKCKPLRAYLLLGIRKEWHLVPLKKDLDECAPPQTAVLEPDDRRREDASNSQRQDREMPDPGS
ncbi:hypothetical protein RvY_01575-1 [Ramazzottius varieornatus]|uniref:Uncharacterized protein n=1 Tax=Ramazzottius varieornatus TaxID=947166 RepID=A0A1D1UK96_RAMVA|nr:hypothetical protein RvY_01575-1 [Ramazzottius varieornatus]